MQDRCEYDQMVLLSISDTEITPEEKQKIETHLKECSSCRKRYHVVSNATATIKKLGMSQEEFLQQSCDEYPEHLNLLIRKSSTIKSDITSKGNSKMAIDDSIVEESNIYSESQSLENKQNTKVPTGTLTPTKPLQSTKVSTNVPTSAVSCNEIQSIQIEKFTIQGKFENNFSEEEICEQIEFFSKELQKIPAKIGGIFNLQFSHTTTTNKKVYRLEVSVTPHETAYQTRWAGIHAGTFGKLEKSIPQMLQWLLAGEPFA